MIRLVYDGSTDESVITVSAGIQGLTRLTAADTTALSLPAAGRAASVTYPEPPSNVSDAWVAIDAELEKYQLRTTGPYRQTLHADNRVTLAAPVLSLTA